MESDNIPAGNKENKASLSSKTVLRTALRILIVLFAGGVIGAVVYFSAAGWVPYLEQRIFEPVENNQGQIQEIAATQHELENQLSFLLEELRENQTVNNQDLESAFASAEGKVDEVKAAVETANAYSLTQVPAQLATMAAKQQANENHISALATAQMKNLGNGFESELANIIALLSRANQFILHANYGLAEDQLVAAQQILVELDEGLDSWQRVQALELTSLIEGAIGDLPGQPILASGKLELAWQLALRGFQALPSQDLQGTPSPTPGESFIPTPTQN